MITTLALLVGGVTVTLPATVDVHGTQMRLGDIAAVQGDEPGEVARVADFDLGYAPAPGYSRLLSREHLAAQLARDFPGIELALAGEARCRVHPTVELVTGEAIQAAGERELARLFGSRKVEIRRGASLANVAVPAGEQPLLVEAILTDRELRPGVWTVPVRLVVDGEVYQTVWTSFDVGLWLTRPVLVRDVNRGEALAPGLIETRHVLVSTGSSENPLAPAALEGAVALRDLAAGTVLSQLDVQRQQVIERGDLVHVEVKKGAITARAVATALQGGRVGDRVRVTTNMSGREMAGVVVSKDLVRIQID